MRMAAVQETSGVRLAKLLAEVFSRFAHDLDELGQPQPEKLVVIEVSALPIGAVGDCLSRGLGEMPKADAVLRPHRGDGRWLQPRPGRSG